MTRMIPARLWIAMGVVVALACGVPAAAAAPDAGTMIYRQGVLPSGTPLVGTRVGGLPVQGMAAACVNCHRRSGLGTKSGVTVIPPISGRYLFRTGPLDILGQEAPRQEGRGPRVPGETPYTEATLARAIRDGIGKDGRTLNPLMPRFELSDADMGTLIAYLRGLSVEQDPGVVGDTLHFAAIITPDANPVQRQGMLDVLDRFFIDKNAFLRGGQRPMRANRILEYRVTRRWQLHVWELTGPPETWGQQLRKRLAEEPVFAVISGLGGKTWAPIHHFCEQEEIPCLFPNVDLPVVAENDYYPIYFSKGVLLEARLIAGELASKQHGSGMRRVIQVFRAGDVGEAAARELAGAAPAGLEWSNRVLAAGEPMARLADTLKTVDSSAAVVFWLRPEDLAALPPPSHNGGGVFMSGIMGGLEGAPLPAPWRATTRMTYPFDLPELRQVRMTYPVNWFKIRRIPVVAERIQSDTYLACGILSETLKEMQDNFVRDYLVERVELMLSHKPTTAYYPRLGLAPGQRFASKGGYLVHFAAPEGERLAADSDWHVP